jgi:HTH-type transcriptional regulator/antitoxin HigA
MEVGMKVKIIKSEKEYEAAMARLSNLMDIDMVPGSEEEAELELLALVIEDYERAIVPMAAPSPVDAILFRIDQQGLSRKDLVPYIGSLPKVSEVLSGKRQLSIAMIRRLHRGLGIPADVLLGTDSDDSIDFSKDPDFDYEKFPLKEMWQRGYFSGYEEKYSKAKEYAEELIRGFMKGFESERNSVAHLRSPLQHSGARSLDESALLIWRICVIKKARSTKLGRNYQKGVITTSWLSDLAKLSQLDEGPKLAKEYLSNDGIALVVEPRFEKTYLDGAAMLDGENPIVALTLRHDRLDNFWFTLMHELIHVQKHLSIERKFIIDNLDDKTRISIEEREADQGAEEALIPSSVLDNSAAIKTLNSEDAIALANTLRIHPSIVAGRIRKKTENWTILTKLVGKTGEVSKFFLDQLQSSGVAVS